MSDTLQRFLFEDLGIRGELVRLDATWQAVLERHDYPRPVRNRLGELMAAGQLLAATLKFDGTLTLQVQGDGPLSMMVVEVTAARTLRGLATWRNEVPEAGLREAFGQGRLVITLDPGLGRERYQGIVALEGEHLAEAIEDYLYRSEQLPTRLWLAADGAAAAGLLVQDLPQQETGAEDWNRVEHLASTITDRELLELSQREVIRRLFHEEDVRVFEPEPVSFRCSCSRDRVEGALRGLGRHELEEILAEQGEITVDCEFCNRRYSFDAVDAEALLSESVRPEGSSSRH